MRLLSDKGDPLSDNREICITQSELDSLKLQWIYARYQQRFPGVEEEQFFSTAKGKSLDSYCLFQHNAPRACKEYGDFNYRKGNKQSAIEAYAAALLSEGHNSKKLNTAILGRLVHYLSNRGVFTRRKEYLGKILNLNPENEWAQAKLKEILSGKHN